MKNEVFVVKTVDEAMNLYEKIYNVISKYNPFSFSLVRYLSSSNSEDNEYMSFVSILEKTYELTGTVDDCIEELRKEGIPVRRQEINSLKTPTNIVDKCSCIQSRFMLEIKVELDGVSYESIIGEYGVCDIFE